MDPSETELAHMRRSGNPLRSAVAYAGITPAVLSALRASLGHFQRVQDIAGMPRTALIDGIKVASVARVIVNVERGVEAVEPRQLNALEQGQAGVLARIARLLSGLHASELEEVAPGAAAGVAAVARGLGVRRVSLANNVDQDNEREVAALASQERRVLAKRYKISNDGLAPMDVDVGAGRPRGSMRFERMENIRREIDSDAEELSARGLVQTSSAKSGDIVSREAAEDHQVWYAEVAENAALYVNHVKKAPPLPWDEGFYVVQAGGFVALPKAKARSSGAKARAAARVSRGGCAGGGNGDRKFSGGKNGGGPKGGGYDVDFKGKMGHKGKGDGAGKDKLKQSMQDCYIYNRDVGGCTEPCPNGRRHQCEYCCDAHPGTECGAICGKGGGAGGGKGDGKFGDGKNGVGPNGGGYDVDCKGKKGPKVKGDGAGKGKGKQFEDCYAYNRDVGGCTEPCPNGRRHQCEHCCGAHPGTECGGICGG
jgi:hypothetical protein